MQCKTLHYTLRLTKDNSRLPEKSTLMLDNWHLAIWVDLGNKPIRFHLQVDVNLFSGNTLCYCNQTSTLWVEGSTIKS